MPGDQLVERLDEPIHNRKPAELGNGSQARDGLRNPEYGLGAGDPAAVWLYDVQRPGQSTGFDPGGEFRQFGRDPLGGHEPEPLSAVEVAQALDGGEAYPAFAVVADRQRSVLQAGSRRKMFVAHSRISSRMLQPMNATMAAKSR